jgi:hypothetical protein
MSNPILTQYDEVMHGAAWYGDPVWKILDGISPNCAAAGLLTGTHNIWQLVMHMAFWERVAVQRAAGPMVPDETRNFPAVPAPDEAAWQHTLEDFRASNREFRELLERLDPAKLDQITPGGDKTYRVEFVGVIEHHIYHAGQIALLKKAFAAHSSGGL